MKITRLRILIILLLLSSVIRAQTFRPISKWSTDINKKLESFMNSTIPIKERKVAVFDIDGTLFGQVPHYLADEALYEYAKERYKGKSDKKSKEKWEIINDMIKGNNVGQDYVRDRIKFLSGMTVEEVEELGLNMYKKKYQGKIYSQMRELVANLEKYGFEIWMVSASPEILYQGFMHKTFGVNRDRILGVRSVIINDTVTNKIIEPVPQDEGKADVIQTFIKERPLFAGGNSRGDMEMLNTSIGIKLMINSDNEKIEKDMGNKTVKQYWNSDPQAIQVKIHDVVEGNYTWITKELGIGENKSNPASKTFKN